MRVQIGKKMPLNIYLTNIKLTVSFTVAHTFINQI